MAEFDEQMLFEMGYSRGFRDGIKGSILKDEYEVRLKADIVAMLTEIQLEIEENVLADDPDTLLPFLQARETCVAVIQQKINLLKESKNGNDRN